MRSAKIWIPAAALVAILVVVIGVVGFGQETSATVSFSNDIMPMFLASCAACHDSEDPSADLNLETNVWENIVGVESTRVEPPMAYVKPGDPQNSYLIHKLAGTHEEVGGRGQRMPRGRDPWTEEQMELIIRWVSEGALNN
ncbi:MAG: hypothetical protein FWJ61_02435 [Limnochordales bacterium]